MWKVEKLNTQNIEMVEPYFLSKDYRVVMLCTMYPNVPEIIKLRQFLHA